MAFNPEAAVKGLDMRVNAAERTIENLQKEFRQSGVKGLEDRIAKLEAVVKAMAEAKVSDKVASMDKTVRALEAAKLVDKPMLDKMMFETARKQSDEYSKEAKAIADKAVADGMKLAEVAKMEARLSIIEAKVNAALSR